MLNKKNNTKDDKENDLDKPDPETLHTPDPPEHMEGPVSSLVQDVRKISEKKSGSKEKKERST